MPSCCPLSKAIDQSNLHLRKSFLGGNQKQCCFSAKSEHQMKLSKKIPTLILSLGLTVLSSVWITGNAQGDHPAKGELVT